MLVNLRSTLGPAVSFFFMRIIIDGTNKLPSSSKRQYYGLNSTSVSLLASDLRLCAAVEHTITLMMMSYLILIHSDYVVYRIPRY